MVKILKYCTLVMVVLLLVQCKTTHTTTTKDHYVSDTLIKHKIEVITLPTQSTWINKTPCKNDSLIIADQFLTIGKLKIQIRNLNGQLVIETNTDSIINSKVKEILKHTEKQVEYRESIITQYRIPKWIWYILSAVLIYIAYRVARIYLPFLKFLPY